MRRLLLLLPVLLALSLWALVYRPGAQGAWFSLFRKDEDPWFTHDLAATEPEELQRMKRIFYAEARRLGEVDLLQPAGSATEW